MKKMGQFLTQNGRRPVAGKARHDAGLQSAAFMPTWDRLFVPFMFFT
jgi:hypothetical protein